jgi:hypothetical protein
VDIILNELQSAKRVLLLIFFSVISCYVSAQNKDYTQLTGELQFSKTINDKWAASVWLGTGFSNTPSNNKILSTNVQHYMFGWVDYHYSSRWKFSASMAHFVNKDVPDIGQYFAPEWRFTAMGVYYIHKLGYTLTTRMRAEFRYIMNEKGVYEDKYRYRQKGNAKGHYLRIHE